MISQTEENYIKAIFKISEKTKENASTNAVAHLMGTSAASVTDMIKRLSEKELVNYEKYRGVSLTNEGNKVATNLIRKHRLWEVFLVENMKYSWDEVHELAEQLEHVQSENLIDRLDNFLGNPKFDPHGDPIPSADGKFMLRNQILLSNMVVGDKGILIGVKIQDKLFLQFLTENKIELGSQLEVINKMAYDHSMLVMVDEKNEITLSEKVNRNLYLKKDNY